MNTPGLNPMQMRTRRSFMTSAASGLGAFALANMLHKDGVLAASPSASTLDPLAPKSPHHRPRAKACIYIFLAGAPSQVDLFDPKPQLHKHAGQTLPESMTKNVRFAFINKDAKLKPSLYRFRPRGQCGMEISDLLPHLANCADDLCMIRSMHTEAFNHHPGHLLMNTGYEKAGFPAAGAWVLYGLGSASANLPGYVVLTSQSLVRGGGQNWSNGFLPPAYQGVHLRSEGEPVLNLTPPRGVTRHAERAGLDALRELNNIRNDKANDPEITSRIEAYELAFRMQAAAPQLMDLSSEKQHMLDAYGVNRGGLQEVVAATEKSRAVSATFSRNCLLARRLIERGVRFVNIFHGDWDHHNGLDQGLKQNCAGVDRPIAALLNDLKQRGLLDETLVVIAGEFGRTPLGQGGDGRDHHPFAFTLLMAGGGVRGGYVHGVTDDFGWRPVKDAVHVHDFHATLLHLFGLDHLKLTHRFQGRDFRLTDVAGHVVRQTLLA